MSADEDKVKEAIVNLESGVYCGEMLSMNPTKILRGIELLREILTPEQPEIPAGCPVIVWDGSEARLKAFFVGGSMSSSRPYDTTRGLFEHCEIDHQRKGHVIPWHGGECPVDDGVFITYWFNDKAHNAQTTEEAEGLRWGHIGSDGDIIAYVIRPEWLK